MMDFRSSQKKREFPISFSLHSAQEKHSTPILVSVFTSSVTPALFCAKKCHISCSSFVLITLKTYASNIHCSGSLYARVYHQWDLHPFLVRMMWTKIYQWTLFCPCCPCFIVSSTKTQSLGFLPGNVRLEEVIVFGKSFSEFSQCGHTDICISFNENTFHLG